MKGSALRNVSLIATILVSATFGTANAVDTLWTRAYFYDTWDTVAAMTEASDSGIVMVGTVREVGESYVDLQLLKTDRYGNVVWRKVYGEQYQDAGSAVIATNDGGYLVGGQHNGVTGVGPLWLFKTDSLGDTLWSYAAASSGFPLAMIQTADSGYALTGLIYVSGLFSQAFILKLDKDGAYDWYHHYGDGRYQEGVFITELPDRGYIVTGSYDTGPTNSYDYWALRTDSLGGIVWDSLYSLSTSYDYNTASVKVDDGIVMTGTVYAEGYIHKIDFDGNTVWSKNISLQPVNERYQDIVTTSDGGFMIGGWLGAGGHGGRDHLYIHTDANGDTLWTFTAGSAEDDEGECLVKSYDDGYLLAGKGYDPALGSLIYLTKIHEYPWCCGLYTEGFTGNTDCGSDGKRNLGDVTRLIDFVYVSKAPLCCRENGNTDGDPDNKINLADILRLIDHVFLSKEETTPCE